MKIRSNRRKTAAFFALTALILSTLVPMSAFAANDSTATSDDSSGTEPVDPETA